MHVDNHPKVHRINVNDCSPSCDQILKEVRLMMFEWSKVRHITCEQTSFGSRCRQNCAVVAFFLWKEVLIDYLNPVFRREPFLLLSGYCAFLNSQNSSTRILNFRNPDFQTVEILVCYWSLKQEGSTTNRINVVIFKRCHLYALNLTYFCSVVPPK